MGAVVFFSVALALYFIPTLIAYKRRHRNAVAIFALNLCLGWSGLGWIGALVWSCTADVLPPRVADLTLIERAA